MTLRLHFGTPSSDPTNVNSRIRLQIHQPRTLAKFTLQAHLPQGQCSTAPTSKPFCSSTWTNSPTPHFSFDILILKSLPVDLRSGLKEVRMALESVQTMRKP